MLNEEVKIGEMIKVVGIIAIPVYLGMRYGRGFGIVSLGIISALNPRKCYICQARMGKKSHYIKIDGNSRLICSTCAHQIKSKRSRDAIRERGS